MSTTLKTFMLAGLMLGVGKMAAAQKLKIADELKPATERGLSMEHSIQNDTVTIKYNNAAETEIFWLTAVNKKNKKKITADEIVAIKHYSVHAAASKAHKSSTTYQEVSEKGGFERNGYFGSNGQYVTESTQRRDAKQLRQTILSRLTQ